MADINLDQIEIIKGSSVLEITNPENTYMLGYKTINGIPTSVRIDFSQMTPLFGLSQEINDSTTTSPSNKAVKTALAGKADKKNGSGHLVVYTPDGKAVTHEELIEALESKAGRKEYVNVSLLNEKYDYLNKEAARNAVPEDIRTLGHTITYQLKPVSGRDKAIWRTEQFVGISLNDWSKPEYWSDRNSSRVFDGGRSDTISFARTINCGGASSAFDGELIDCGGAN